MLAIITGTPLFDIKDFKEERIETPYGCSEILRGTIKGKNIVLLLRHGKAHNIPPHKINHLANIYALKQVGVKEIIGVNSTGSLKLEIKPSSILIPDDYINLFGIISFYNNEINHIIPGLDKELRNRIIEAAKNLGISVFETGTYIQTKGPRLETKAEINMLKNFGDVIGMTMANEATLAKELSLKYASICLVSNYCNGISTEEINIEKIREDAKKSSIKVKKIIEAILGF